MFFRGHSHSTGKEINDNELFTCGKHFALENCENYFSTKNKYNFNI